MNIFINEEKLQFHLQNNEVSYIFGVLKNNHLGNCYYGKNISHQNDFSHMFQQSNYEIAVTPNPLKDDIGFSLDLIKAEYPNFGQGDYREPAMEILQEDGSTLTDFKYKCHKIIEGKPKLSGLPSTYIENKNEALTLEVVLEDKVIDTQLVLTYTIYKDYSALTRNVKIINSSEKTLNVKRLMSMNVDLERDDYTMFHLSGTWSRERQIIEREALHGKLSIESTRGTSSSNHNPFIGIKKGYADENIGEVYGFNLVYSGNFKGTVEKDHYGITRISMGINPFNFNWELEKQTEFQTPEVVMVYSDEGISKMSKTFNTLYRKRLARGQYRDKERPILLNNWEATYFDFDEDKILNIASKAKELGVELFVLDDGWFGSRNNDHQGLGDWDVNLDKLPSGIKGLSEKIENMGLKFGLWFEPEMVNKDSELYREHPDWIIEMPNRPNTPSRKQHTLDFSRSDVREHIYNKMKNVIKDSKISYIKWDMNRPMTEVMSSSLTPNKQGEVAHRYILGLYDLLEKLTNEFPNILFESCASGGNRFDGGMLYYMPQAWTSDDTDAIERLKIQYGTSMVYPISSMGAHVSAIPNHQTGRNTDINLRANVAFFGAFGYELDLNSITKGEQDRVVEQIKFMKENRKTLQFGDFYRLRSPYKGEKTTWISVSKDKNNAVVGDYTRLIIANNGFDRVKLKGLDPEKAYRVEASCPIQNTISKGDELMNSGLIFGDTFFGTSQLSKEDGDFKGRIIKLTSIK
jgi:alpha-galactosidase